MRRARLPLALLATTALVPGSCARAHNYLDPVGPLYMTDFGAVPARRDRVRVVTFNIKHARRIDRAIEVLDETAALRDADLLLLQEMDAPGTERIARALRLNSVYFPSTVHPHDGKDFGNAVLSPWPIEAARKLLLPHESRLSRVRRAAAVATVRIGGRRVRAYSVHLETVLRLRASARREQLQAILDDARDSEDPVVIGGDLNSRDLGEIAARDGHLWVTVDVRNTAAWFDVDHVFARGLHPAAQPAAGAAPNQGASDHRPVWAVLRFD